MLKERFQPLRSATHVERAEWAVNGPPQADRTGDDVIKLINGDNALLHQVARLAHDSALQAIGDETLNLLLKHARHLAYSFVERDRIGDCIRIGTLAGNDFDQRDQVRRIERMANEQTARVLHLTALLRRRARRTR